MTFLAIMKAVAKNAGIEVPNTVQSSDPDRVKLAEFINEAGDEVARRVDWGALRKRVTLTGDGTPAPLTIAGDFDRLTRGLSVLYGVDSVRGSLTQDEWFALPTQEGEPRFFYLRVGQLGLWPFLSHADAIDVQYQSRNWAESNSAPAAKLTLDDDQALVSEKLLVAGGLWRWRRHVGKDFADYLAEFEAMLADLSQFDGGVRAP